MENFLIYTLQKNFVISTLALQLQNVHTQSTLLYTISVTDSVHTQS